MDKNVGYNYLEELYKLLVNKYTEDQLLKGKKSIFAEFLNTLKVKMDEFNAQSKPVDQVTKLKEAVVSMKDEVVESHGK